MKKTKLVLLGVIILSLSLPTIAGETKSAGEIIKKFTEAIGGADKIGALKTLRISVKYQGHKYTNIHDIKRPNLFRTTNDTGSYVSIFDGKRACFIQNKDGKSTFELIKKEDMPDFVAEPGFFTFYFLDFPTSYLGKQSINNRDTYKLEVKLPFEVVIHYYIDCKTNLLLRTVAHVTMRGKKIEWIRDYFDYKRVAGILYPHSFVYFWDIRPKKEKAVITGVEFNISFPKGHFKIEDK